ncbi:MAG: LptA/OstA family protein [Thermodesulfobacteriota bacterium]
MDKVRAGSSSKWPKAAVLFIIFFICLSLSTLEASAGERGKGSAAEKPPITITSKTMHADRTARTVIFKGDVEAREDFLLCSDELHMSYTGANVVQKIDARGNVRIFRDKGKAISEQAVYDRVRHILILTGSPVVERCADTVRGDKITLYLDDDSVLVEGAENGRVKAVIVPDKKCNGTGDKKGVVKDAKDFSCK